MTSQILSNRLQKEIMVLERDPPPGVSCYPKEDDLTKLEAYIKGPPETPYERGRFKLDVQIPNSYPFDPPQIRFVTRIYHPNIDDAGRICADILKKGENGGWKPSLNLRTTLLSLSQLLANPNPDDPLDAEIAREYQIDLPTFSHKALDFTLKYANEEAVMSCTTEQEETKIEMREQGDMSEEAIIKSKPKLSLSLSKKKSTTNSSQSTSSQSSLSSIKSPGLKRKPFLENSQALESALKKSKTPKEAESNVNISKKEILPTDDQTTLTATDVPEPEEHIIKSKHFTSCNTKLAKSVSKPKQMTIKEAQVNVMKQTLANNTPQEQQQDTKRNPKQIIVLSDDEDDGILHSFQLSRKINRTKLSLSKRRK
ncbi:ubiquitin-conjugating enzyme/RWD-like protein [Parasitella parasitica]|nr:ubiquitin-conjugating enzyme/RWD-like protein [Parasitella parasitica]